VPRIQTADITALIRERFQIKGAGSIDTLAPEIVGVVALDPLLQYRALVADVTQAVATPGAGSTTANTLFSLTRPALLTAISARATAANAANLDHVRLRLADPAGAGLVDLFLSQAADFLPVAGSETTLPNVLPLDLPLFIPAGWEFTWRVRSTAGGATEANLEMLTLTEAVR